VELIGRRDFIGGAAACLGVLPGANAQPVRVIHRIGYLALQLSGAPRLTASFRRGLRELGYSEGRDLIIEFRDAEGRPERLDALAQELVANHVDLIVTAGTLPALAASRATGRLPIVVIGAADAVTSGMVTSLAQPGGNVTGLSLLLPELVGKRLELFKQTVPSIRRVAVLWQPGGSAARTEQDLLQGAQAAGQALGLELRFMEARRTADIDGAFAEMKSAQVDALTVLSTPMFGGEQKRVVALAVRHRLPTMFQFREYVDAGGLMSYGPDLPDLYRRAAVYVDKILRGANPGSLPVEQPTKFELVINLRTAKELGVALSRSVLGRADALLQ
jgi:putative ABC transport system substrate-binding protein